MTPNARSPRQQEENKPVDNSFYGMFASMLGIKKSPDVVSPNKETKVNTVDSEAY